MIYSTQGVHPRERLSYWREVATRGFVEHECAPASAQSFEGVVQLSSLPGLALSAYDVDAALVTRSQRAAARTDTDDVLFGMVRSGSVIFSQDGREGTARRGDMYLVDPLRAFDLNIIERTSSVVVKIPRAKLEARIGNLAPVTARVLAPTTSVGALVGGFISMLPTHAEGLDEMAGLKIADQTLDLAAMALATATDGKRPAMSSPRTLAMLRLKATVERLLIEPGLKPERIAIESGISVRYANALLFEEGTSLERYVQGRRLERCRQALDDINQSHRTIGEIAYNWGFSDLSHFGRRFKAQFGVTPTEYRRQAIAIAAMTK
jgi:AraC-like DNA-binding protein